eukprot:gnl/MRDRNA2_/MRDRNA2_63763_c0_seq1.p1 gnl/MRDRNA2_/MRDRNA2_63763_c0~~gnl/MRDRNA2_/MRDRNA2_63763_c0_seq1.p1  ORF type:complete len:745 (+),score=97.69 gnl/MRDRNA2_/MRDRNA2_63763_c0_seq1:85-2319(+)
MQVSRIVPEEVHTSKGDAISCARVHAVFRNVKAQMSNMLCATVANNDYAKLSTICSLTCATSGVFLWLYAQPQRCSEVQVCEALKNKVHEIHHEDHFYSALLLAPCLLQELFFWGASFRADFMVFDTSGQRIFSGQSGSSLMTCFMVTVLMSVHFLFASGISLTHSAVPFANRDSFRPVFTMRYVQWLATVPVLLVISGHYCLGRPVAEVLPPVIMTNVYIFLAWLAFFVDTFFWCMMLTLLVFGLFTWASFNMAMWGVSSSRELSMAMSCFPLRVSITVALILVFAWYGVIYLLALLGIWDAETEDFMYTWGDVFVKMILVLCLNVLRLVDHIRFMQVVTGESNAKMSLLRGSFDIVLSCTINSNGICSLPVTENADVSKLMHGLNMSLPDKSKYVTLNGLIATDTEKALFKSYVMSMVNHGTAMQSTVDEDAPHSPRQQAVSQILNLTLSAGTMKRSAQVHVSSIFVTGNNSLTCLATSMVAISLLESTAHLDDEGIKDESDHESQDSVPSLRSSTTCERLKDTFDRSPDADSLQVSETDDGSELSFAFTAFTCKSSKRRSSSKKKITTRECDAQTVACELIDVAVQTDWFGRRPPLPPSEKRLVRPFKGSVVRVSKNDSKCQSPKVTSNANALGSSIQSFDGVWRSSIPNQGTRVMPTCPEEEIELIISRGKVLYSIGGCEKRRTKLVFVDNLWHFLNAPITCSAADRFSCIGKSGNRSVFERTVQPGCNRFQQILFIEAP